MMLPPLTSPSSTSTPAATCTGPEGDAREGNITDMFLKPRNREDIGTCQCPGLGSGWLRLTLMGVARSLPDGLGQGPWRPDLTDQAGSIEEQIRGERTGR